MTLPNPGMDAVPFTPITSQWGDEVIENIEALQDWSAFDNGTLPGALLTNGAVTGPKISTNAILLDHQTKTSNQVITTGGGNQSISLSSTVTIPAGGRSVKIECFIGSISSGGGAALSTLRLWSGSIGGTQLAAQTWKFQDSGDNKGQYMYVIVPAPSAGSHTYVASMATSTANIQINASSTTPASFTVTLL